MPNDRESFLMYKSFYEPVKNLSLEHKGLLLVAIFEWQVNNTEIQLPAEVKMCFAFFKNQFRLDDRKYSKVSEIRAEYGKKGGLAKASKSKQSIANVSKATDNDNENENENDNEKDNIVRAKNFAPPTIDEVRKYCEERKNRIDPEKFIAYYEARGWNLGKGVKMKNWHSCITTWEKRDDDGGNKENAGIKQSYKKHNQELILQISNNSKTLEFKDCWDKFIRLTEAGTADTPKAKDLLSKVDDVIYSSAQILLITNMLEKFCGR